MPASVPDDADAVIWKKFVLSSVYPVFALGRMPFSVGFNDPQACPVLERAMGETVAAAAAMGLVADLTGVQLDKVQRLLLLSRHLHK